MITNGTKNEHTVENVLEDENEQTVCELEWNVSTKNKLDDQDSNEHTVEGNNMNEHTVNESLMNGHTVDLRECKNRGQDDSVTQDSWDGQEMSMKNEQTVGESKNGHTVELCE